MAKAQNRRNTNVCHVGAERLAFLMAERGWTPADLEAASETTGHPLRKASQRVVYRVLNESHKPTPPIQFEIAASLGLRPSHIWGAAPWADSVETMAMVTA